MTRQQRNNFIDMQGMHSFSTHADDTERAYLLAACRAFDSQEPLDMSTAATLMAYGYDIDALRDAYDELNNDF